MLAYDLAALLRALIPPCGALVSSCGRGRRQSRLPQVVLVAIRRSPGPVIRGQLLCRRVCPAISHSSCSPRTGTHRDGCVSPRASSSCSFVLFICAGWRLGVFWVPARSPLHVPLQALSCPWGSSASDKTHRDFTGRSPPPEVRGLGDCDLGRKNLMPNKIFLKPKQWWDLFLKCKYFQRTLPHFC